MMLKNLPEQTLLGANSLALVPSFMKKKKKKMIRGSQVKGHSVRRGWQELMQQLLGAFLALLTIILLIKLPFDVLAGSIGGNFRGGYGTPREEGGRENGERMVRDDPKLSVDGGEVPKSQGRGRRFDSQLRNPLST
jgi:hypothetical protein